MAPSAFAVGARAATAAEMASCAAIHPSLRRGAARGEELRLIGCRAER